MLVQIDAEESDHLNVALAGHFISSAGYDTGTYPSEFDRHDPCGWSQYIDKQRILYQLLQTKYLIWYNVNQ